ncbi:hypothetical protein QQF64_026512 [Cirrhinus molitorella]|uniref:Serine protease n=1 Tax=Cirrhinus molitorella TaxID=172907 RepID=A0ABR3NAA7_9TELE
MKQPKVKTESNEALAADSEKNDPDQHPTSTEQKPSLHTESNTKSTSLSTKWPIISDSTEILEILRAQFKDLLETLEKRMNPEGQKTKLKPHTYFRAEYDKSVQSFSEMYKIKKLMILSASVCQIQVEESPRGTGFLLFDRFILTNAHVIGEFDLFTRKLLKTFTAVFGYEDLDTKKNTISNIVVKNETLEWTVES